MQTLVRIWILLSAWLVASGWILSAFHALNRTGYVLAFVPVAVAAFFWRQKTFGRPRLPSAPEWRKFWRRFRRPAPVLFLSLCLLNIAAGLIWKPENGDSNAYRVPRVLHWLWQEGWYWIHTGDSRTNIAGCGYEWLYTPLISFTRTDRWIFLPNLFSFVLLPSLIFSVLRQMRIRSRVAWWWMWILASGWCYVLQADSTVNDSISVVYALAAVDFALRARNSGRSGELWLSLLAAGLLTGVKPTNLPLLLPWFIAAWPTARLLLKQPAISVGAIVLALLVSALPMACLDWLHTGSFVGFPKEATGQIWAWGERQALTSPFWGIVGNLFCIPEENLLPLFFPPAAVWNHAMHQFLQTPLGSHFQQFENFGYLGRSVSEATAGIGLGVVALALLSIVAVHCLRLPPATKENPKTDWWLRCLYLSPWAALLVFMAKAGTYQNARLIAPYYVLLFPLILAGASQVWLTRQRWWHRAALLVLVITVAYLGFVRGRASVPIAMVARLQEQHPHAKWLAVFGDYYRTSVSVSAYQHFVEKSEAAGERLIGFATTCSGAEPNWWLPFGQRQVERVLPGDSPLQLRQQGMHYVVVEDLALQTANQTIEQWGQQYRGDLVRELAFTKDPNTPPGHLYLVHLRE